MTQQRPESYVKIWDHPESRIAFLETTLRGQDWHAVIYPQQGEGSMSLEDIQKKLERRGYATQIQLSSNDEPSLLVHHLGDEAGFNQSIQELGLVKGSAHSIKNIGVPIGQAVSAVKGAVHHTTSDRARLMSALYLCGDVLNTISGWTNHGIKETSHNAYADSLYGFGNALSALQSLIYMGYAEAGSAVQQRQLTKQYTHALKQGYDPIDTGHWDVTLHDKHGLVGKIDSVLRHHPIEAGAISQILGFASVAASGGLRLNQDRHRLETASAKERKSLEQSIKSGKFDIIAALTSCASWAIIMHPPKPKEHDQTNETLTELNIWEKVKENPARLSATLSGFSSILGIASAGARGNNWQRAGQGVWMAGDVAMFTVRTDNYGKKGATKEDHAAEAAAAFIATSPIVLGSDELHQFVRKVSDHLAEQILHDKSDDEPDPKELHTVSRNIMLATMQNLVGKQLRATHIAHSIAQMAWKFPEACREGLLDSLTEAIAEAEGVYIKQDELRSMASQDLENIRQTINNGSPAEPPSMLDISPHISSIVLDLPPMCAAVNASRLYDAVKPLMKCSARDSDHLQRAMEQQVAEASQLPPHSITALQRAVAPNQHTLH